jgi:hypothetical protein
LSQNQILHVYAQTQEEVLVNILRDMIDAKGTGVKGAVVKCLEAQQEAAAINRNTKLTKVMNQTRLMYTLMGDVLPMGEHFRPRREFDVAWLSKAINVVMGVSASN